MKTNFLQFDSLQIKQSIYEVLKNDARYTGYLYLDTKLSAFIDSIAASHETLMFYLNNQVADSVFSSTQNDSNMLGIVKLIDYHAKGMIPSSVDARVYPTSQQFLNLGISFTIPKEAYYYDSIRGKYWSPAQDYTIGSKILAEGVNMTFVCGNWADSGGRWVTNGTPSQLIELTSIDTTMVGWPYFDIYVNGEKWVLTYDKSIERYLNLDSSTNRVVELNINENLKYSLRFGDGTNGQIPPAGSIVTVKYLSSSDGSSGRINGNKMVDLFSIDSQPAFRNIVVAANPGLDWNIVTTSLSSTNSQQTALNFGSEVETADSIRSSAPLSVYANDKLVRSSDYRNYILANYPNIVSDIKVQNNFEFASTFYSWLDQYALLDWNVRKYGYGNLGSNDSGNVYLWFAGSSSNTDFTRIINDISPIVANGQNPVAMTGAEQFIQFGFYSSSFSSMASNQIISLLTAGIGGNRFKIVIKKSSTSAIDNSTLKNNVIAVILSYFSSKVRKFGATISADALTNNIKKISGVDSVSMRFVDAEGKTLSSIAGLSFAMWNTNYLNGADLTINSGLNYNSSDIVAEPFMYFSFVNTLVTGSMVVVESGR